MVEIRRAMAVSAVLSLLLFSSVGNAQAAPEPRECREAHASCLDEAGAAGQVCRQDCQADVREAIATARAVCEEQGLEGEACRELIHESVKAVAGECRRECKAARKEDRRECRQANRECRDAVIDPLDDECVAVCRDDFGACRHEQRPCHDECRASAQDVIDSCRDSGLGPRELQRCIRQAHRDAHACSLECHDAYMCHGDLRECLRECPVEQL